MDNMDQEIENLPENRTENLPENRTEYVAYYRVSRKTQGDGKKDANGKTQGTGHGLEAQLRDVGSLMRRFDGVVIGSQTEIESGGKDDRPKLALAVAQCKKTGATLVVAKLDRLARSVSLISSLQKAEVDFICADNPHMTELTVNILAAVAQEELRMIRSRTKAGLQSAKLKGVLLGGARPGHRDGRGFNDGVKRANKVKSDKARNYYAAYLPRIKLMRENGDTIQQIVDWLNDNGHTTSTRRPWTTKKLYEIMARYMPDENLLTAEAELVELAGKMT